MQTSCSQCSICQLTSFPFSPATTHSLGRAAAPPLPLLCLPPPSSSSWPLHCQFPLWVQILSLPACSLVRRPLSHCSRYGLNALTPSQSLTASHLCACTICFKLCLTLSGSTGPQATIFLNTFHLRIFSWTCQGLDLKPSKVEHALYRVSHGLFPYDHF